ncbi:MAG: hypothetical protein WBA45_12610 [Microthrixaceae bacterium]
MPNPLHRPALRGFARQVRLLVVLVLATTAVGAGLTSCSDLLEPNKPDAVVSIPVEGSKSLDEARKEVKEEAAAVGGVRVGEDTTDPDQVVLEFMLPGKNLDAAVAALERLNDDSVSPGSVSTEVDVDENKLTEDSSTKSAKGSTGTSKDEEAGRVRLRVEIAKEAGSSALVTALGAMMLLFSIIGLITSFRWVLRKLGMGRRHEVGPPSRRVGRPDLDLDPPTQETPLVPRQY